MVAAAKKLETKEQLDVQTLPKKVKKERIYTLREYLEREERSIYKHEFHNGKIKRMAGGKFRHSAISNNIGYALKAGVKLLPIKYHVCNSDLKIYIESFDKSVYPDALVICEEPQYWDDREDLITNPLVIVEVASRTTSDYDRGAKFLMYETLPSFKEYVLVEQDFSSVEVWYRESENLWRKSIENIVENSIKINALGISIALSDVYDNIDFKKK